MWATSTGGGATFTDANRQGGSKSACRHVALPFAWFIVDKLPLRERVWWSIGLLVIAFPIKKLVYYPIARRMT